MRDGGVRMLVFLVRAAVPLVLMAGGIGSVVYGVARHSAVVSWEQEIEIDLAPPTGMEPGGFGLDGFGPPGPGFDPSWDGPPPWMAPPAELLRVKETVVIGESASEPALIREVTFGGVTRLSSGALWRTYTGDPPSLCPT